jgi:hypothetical protein
MEFNVGDKVVFGRKQGEKTLGVITKVNRRTYKIRQQGARGTKRIRPDGTIWTVAKALVEAAPSDSAEPKSPPMWEPPKPVAEYLDADGVQFPRLLAEINAVGLTDEQYAALRESTGLSDIGIRTIFTRAEQAWDEIKYA